MANKRVEKLEKKLSSNQKVLKNNKKTLKKDKVKNKKKAEKTKKRTPETVQDTLAYKAIFPDGICQINNRKFSKTIQFFDINYLLAQNEDKTLIFDNYCDFLNYFDSSISIQLSFVNMAANTNVFLDAIKIDDQNDDFNTIRKEYSDMLQNQLAKGNNGLMKTKYITFSIDSDNYKKAKPRLERIEMDIINNFKVMTTPRKVFIQNVPHTFIIINHENFEFIRWFNPARLR